MNKNKTIGELIDEARKMLGEPVLAGHDIMALERLVVMKSCVPSSFE